MGTANSKGRDFRDVSPETRATHRSECPPDTGPPAETGRETKRRFRNETVTNARKHNRKGKLMEHGQGNEFLRHVKLMCTVSSAIAATHRYNPPVPSVWKASLLPVWPCAATAPRLPHLDQPQFDWCRAARFTESST